MQQNVKNPYCPVDDANRIAEGSSNEIDPYAIDKNIPYEDDIRESFVADKNPLLEKKGSIHVRSLIATILLFVGISVPLIVYIMQDEVVLSSSGVIGICISAYIVYLLLALICNPLNGYLGNIRKGVQIETQYEKVRMIEGHFSMNVVCYHYETRHHTRTIRDANGNTRTEHYTTTEKVVTHTACQNVYPARSIDQSGTVDEVRAKTQIIFVHMKVNYRFDSEDSRRKFDRIWDDFKRRHRFDVHQDYSYDFLLPGLIPRMTFYVGELTCNYRVWLFVSAFLGVLWPYSLWIETLTSRFDIIFLKSLTM